MKEKIYNFILACSSLTLLACGNQIKFDGVDLNVPFTSVWQIDNSGDHIAFELPGTYDGDDLNYNFVVNWGDGESEQITTAGIKQHFYDEAGTYTVIMTGLIQGFTMYNQTDSERQRLISVPELGHNGWVNLSGAFIRATNLQSAYGGDFSQAKDLSNMFYFCTNVVVDTRSWDVSQVKEMRGMFESTQVATPDTSLWDTRSLERIGFMFQNAAAANPDVSNWNTSNLYEARHAFSNTTLATPDVSNWDSSKLEDIRGLFRGLPNANPDFSNWSFESVTLISGFLDGTNISQLNYDSFLTQASQTATAISQNLGGVGLSGSRTEYSSSSTAARTVLTSTLSWTIIDGGVAP